MAKSKLEWNAETVRALRKHMGLTQKQLAEQINARQQTISEWETGMYKPRGTTIALLNIIAERAGFEYRTTRDADAEDEQMASEGDIDPSTR